VYGNAQLNRWVASLDEKNWTLVDNSAPTSVGNYIVDASKTPSGGSCIARTDNSQPPCVSLQGVIPPASKIPQSSQTQESSFSQLFSCDSAETCPDAATYGKYCCGAVKNAGPCPGQLTVYGSNSGTFCVQFTNSPSTFVVQASAQAGATTGLIVTDGKSVVTAGLKKANGDDAGVKATFDFSKSPGQPPKEVEFQVSRLPTTILPAPQQATSATFPGAIPGDADWVSQWGATLCCTAGSGGDNLWSAYSKQHVGALLYSAASGLSSASGLSGASGFEGAALIIVGVTLLLMAAFSRR